MDRAGPGPVLVANRGEVAVRIVRACRELGLPSIVVHTDVDAGALPTRVADTAVARRVVPRRRRRGRRGARPRCAGGAPGLRPARRGRGVRAGGHRRRPRVRRPARRGGGGHGRQGARAGARPGVRGAGAGRHGGGGRRRRGRGRRRADRLPAAGQGRARRRGRGMRVVAGPDELPGALAAAGREAAAAFGRRRGVPRALRRPRAPRRGADPRPTTTARSSPSATGTAPCSAATRSCSRRRPRPACSTPCAPAARGGPAARRGRRLPRRGHRGVPARPRHRRARASSR